MHLSHDRATAPTLDAVIAADRLALSEASGEAELLRRRLTVFYGYFALVGILGTLVGARSVLVDFDPTVVAFVRQVQAAHALLLSATFLALRFRVRSVGPMRGLDFLATLGTSVTAGATLSVIPRALTVDVTAVSFFVLFFALRAALVPSKPWQATLVATAAALPFAIGLANLYERALVPDPLSATFGAVRAMTAGVAGVYVVSRTIYGLRRVVEQAVRLGQYVVHEKIGEGGMGVVYLARHAMLKRPTAIKLIAPEHVSEIATARFEREVMAASRLSHPNNVAIYDYGRTQGGVFYYAMELLQGVHLARLVASEGPQSPARTLHILRQVGAALREAHDAGLVHRDVKPENLMLCTYGGVRDFVKVLDFGLVKEVATSGATKVTADTSVAGTPHYMAPETFLEPAAVGPATDVYAVGCVAYFLLTGRPPFEGNGIVQVCAAHATQAPQRPSSRAPGVPEKLDELVVQCLEKNAAWRPTTRELCERLDALANETAALPMLVNPEGRN